MSTWNKKNFSIYTSDEKSALGLIKELGEQTNYNTEEIEKVKESDNKKVSHDEMNNIYKIDKNADFTGSWYGIKKPTASQEGLQATVDKIVEEDIPSINEQMDTKASYINIEDYKQYSNGNDYTQSLKYIIDNIVDNVNNFVIYFNKNKTYILNNKINKKYITLTGGAIINGCLEIGLTNEELESEWYDTFMSCKIIDLTFNPSANNWTSVSTNTSQGLRLKNAKDVKINKCTFKNMVYPIKLLTRNNEKSGHTVRVYITDCNFFNVSYNLFSEDSSVTDLDGSFEYGDITFNNNICQETKIANIILSRQDGFVCQGNTFFLERQSYNIFLNKSTIINISNNQLFESGDCSIYLKNCYVANVNSNNIYWSSKITKRACILVEGVNCWGDNKVLININNNILEKPHGNGIEILKTGTDNMQGVIVSDNIIYIRDTNSYKSIVNNNTGIGIIINNNIINGKCTRTEISEFSSSSHNSILDSRTIEYKNIYEQWINTTSTPTISYNCTNYITLTSGSVTSIDDLNINSSVQRGTELIITNPSESNKIIKNSNKIKTRSGNDLTLLPNTVARFIYNNNVFCEY